MAITKSLQDNEVNKFVESTSVPGQPAIPVVNPDGSNLSISLSASDIQIGAVEIKDATGSQRANVRDLTNSDALNVAIVDGSGDQITSFGGGTQYTEGATDATITGTVAMWEDAADTVVATSEAKPLPVNIVSGSSSGTQYTEDDAAAANPVGTALNLIRKDTLAGLTTTDGDNVAARGTDKGELYVKHVDAIPVTDNSGSLTVDGTVTANLAAGTNNIGDVDILSIAAGDNNIGNVDVVSSALPTGAATAANQTTLIGHVDGIEGLLTTIDADTSNLSVVGSGTEATAVRVTIASDSTGVLSVDDNGSSLTVDNAGLTELAAAINASSQVDVNIAASGATVPVSNAGLTELASAINASSQMDVNIAASAVSFGGTSAADDADFTAGTTPGTPAMGIYESTPTSVTDGDLGTVGITSGRRLKTSATIDAALPAGTNAIGKLAANDGVDIGDVSINNATIAVTQSGTWDEVGINDSGNSITVDDGASSLTVDNAGTFAVQVDGAALTSLQLIDDAVYTDGTGTPSKALAVAGTDGTNPQIISTNATGHVNIADGGNTITVDGTVTANLASGTNNIGDVDILSIAAGDNNIGNVDIASIAAGDNNIGNVDIASALPAGTNTIGKLAANSGVDIGDVDVTSIAAGTNTIGNVGLIGRTSGGLSIFRSIDIDETEEEIKASAGQVFTITAFNRTAAPVYLKFYNATAANVTVGTTTPVMTFVVPANADSDGAGFVHSTDIGYAFGTAITVAATTGIADNDTGAPGANDCVINIGYV